MNELAPVANQCWAAAAADGFDVQGAVRMLVSVARAPGTKAKAEATLDEPDDPVLIRCLADVLAAYAWAPPLYGQTIELPFAFTAPAMQNVIDRRLVPHKAQAGVDVAVLLDQLNTGNPGLSLLEVTLAPGARVGPRQVERTELWIFRDPARVAWVGQDARMLADGEALLVPHGARLQVEAGGDAKPTTAVVAIVPGGREGAARAGALPGATTAFPPKGGKFPEPVVVPIEGSGTYPRPGGGARVRVEPGFPRKHVGRELSFLVQSIDAGAAVPPHVHAGETEVLYLLAGAGTMTVGGVSVPVSEYSVIQIPPGVEHSFIATATTAAMQFYSPAGPEQRFKKKP